MPHYTVEDDFNAHRPMVSFEPGPEPKIVRPDQRLMAPKVAIISVDALEMLVELLDIPTGSNLNVVQSKLQEILEGVN